MRAKSIPAADNHIADGDKALLKMTTVLASGTYTLFRETRIIPARILTSGIPQNTRARGNFLLTSFPVFFLLPIVFTSSFLQRSSPFLFFQCSAPLRLPNVLPRVILVVVLPRIVFFLCSAPIDFSNLLPQIIFSCVLPQFILSHLLPRIIYPKFFASSFFDVFPWFILQCFFPR